MPITLTCQHCHKLYSASPYKIREGRFCSRDCKNESQRTQMTKPCDLCSKPITRKPSGFKRNTSGVFCNKKCAADYRSLHTRQSIRFDYSRRFLPKVLIERYGTACFICGFDRYVEYAHIIPANQGGTTHPDNIVALCPNHHSLMDRDLLTKEESALLTDHIIKAWGSEKAARFTCSSVVPGNARIP